jgi:mannose-1-phosphate guanylyltransferase
MKAMVLAAGLGTRLRPYTSICPKPLFPVMGEALILRIINHLRLSGFTQIVVNAYHLKDQLVELLGNDTDVMLQVEPIELGTGGGLRMALDVLAPGPVLVTNADIYHDIDYRWVYEGHCRQKAGATLVMHDFPRFNKVAVSENGNITSFKTTYPLENNQRARAFTGIQMLETDLLTRIPPGQFYSIIDAYDSFLADGGTLRALIPHHHFWQDIGTPADYLGLHAHLLAGRPRVKQVGHGEANFMFGAGVEVENDVTFKDWGYVGANVHIGAASHLERVVIWDGAIVPPKTIAIDEIITQ